MRMTTHEAFVMLLQGHGFAGAAAFGISMSEMSSIDRDERPRDTMVIFGRPRRALSGHARLKGRARPDCDNRSR